jgi:hypothetical protein
LIPVFFNNNSYSSGVSVIFLKQLSIDLKHIKKNILIFYFIL